MDELPEQLIVLIIALSGSALPSLATAYRRAARLVECWSTRIFWLTTTYGDQAIFVAIRKGACWTSQLLQRSHDGGPEAINSVANLACELPLTAAVAHGSADTVSLLLDHGADPYITVRQPDAKRSFYACDSYSLLALACDLGRSDIACKLLLHNGSQLCHKLDVLGPQGFPIIAAACQSRLQDVLDILVRAQPACKPLVEAGRMFWCW